MKNLHAQSAARLHPPLLLTALLMLLALLFPPSPLVNAAEHAWQNCAAKGQHLNTLYESKPGIGGRHYERDRRVDVKHLKLELEPDFAKQGMTGVATLTFSPIAKDLEQLQLDAVDLSIEKIESSAPLQDWQNDDKKLTLTFKQAIPATQENWVKITYTVEKPEHGLYFRTAVMGYKKGDDQLWTQGEPEKHRYWFPGYDYPNERFTSEVICKVPQGMIVLSNGKLLSEKSVDGFTTFHWSQQQPHANYLISVVAGYFKKLEDQYQKIPLAFYTPPSEFKVAANSFSDTKKIMAFFEKEIGVDYPWDKYYSVCVHDFVAGGMENTSLTTLTTNTLFSKSSENIRRSYPLDAHEMAHQWFGDLVTAKDWSQLWLNEGFATFYTNLYEQSKNGDDAMRYQLYLDAQRIIKSKDNKPITWRGYTDPWQQFDYRVYPKGGWVLHMLRSQLGSELYQKCIQSYVERNRGQTVETADLRKVIEEFSGRSWDRFFDQWVHHGGTPKLKVSYHWDEKRSQAKLSISQTQKVSDQVMLFVIPMPVRLIVDGKAHDFTINLTQASEDFYFDLAKKPDIIRIDPEYTLLTDIDFHPPTSTRSAQLKNEKDMMGRLLAVKLLAGKKDSKSIAKLKNSLNHDSFYGVRIEAAKALVKTHSPEALIALTQSLQQENARVRREAVKSLAKFYSETALTSLKQVAEKENNPEVAASAIDALGKFPAGEVRPLLAEVLKKPSFRNTLASAAIHALRDLGAASDAKLIMDVLKGQEQNFTTYSFGSALNSLAILVRDEKTDSAIHEEVRTYVTGYLSSPKLSLRTSAMRALSSLKDRRSLGALQTFIDSGNSESKEYKAAESAIKKLQVEKKQATEVSDLRKELLEMQKEMKDLEKQFETEKNRSLLLLKSVRPLLHPDKK
ncbi:MAG: M1 family aminopeptidase [Verrucomicrobiota bacterium]